MKKKSKIILIIAIVCTLICAGWATVRIVKSVQFDFDCKAYLKRAADANTVELAKGELGKAIEYIEDNKLTEGVISIFLENPANDLGFWYQNIKSAYEELDNLGENSSALEKTNVLMKLRESLTDSSDGDSTSVITPEGITVYPNNVIYFVWGLLSFILTIVFWIAFCISIDLKLDTDTVQVRKKVIVKKSA